LVSVVDASMGSRRRHPRASSSRPKASSRNLADEAATVLEQVSTIAQAAQAEILAAAERSGELKDSGCRSARSFAAAILRRSPASHSPSRMLVRRLRR